jgi:hypothetical protein
MKNVLRTVSIVVLLAVASGGGSVLGGGKKGEEAPIVPFLYDKAGAVYYEETLDVEGAKRDELFTSTEKWIADNFSKSEIENHEVDSSRDWLTFNTFVRTPKGWRGIDEAGDGYLRFEVVVKFKDEKVKIRIADFHFRLADAWRTNPDDRMKITDREMFTKGGKKPQAAKVLLQEELDGLIATLEQKFATEDYGDW